MPHSREYTILEIRNSHGFAFPRNVSWIVCYVFVAVPIHSRIVFYRKSSSTQVTFNTSNTFLVMRYLPRVRLVSTVVLWNVNRLSVRYIRKPCNTTSCHWTDLIVTHSALKCFIWSGNAAIFVKLWLCVYLCVNIQCAYIWVDGWIWMDRLGSTNGSRWMGRWVEGWMG